jgi:hypothetical protein
MHDSLEKRGLNLILTRIKQILNNSYLDFKMSINISL